MQTLDAFASWLDRFTGTADRAFEKGGRFFLVAFTLLYFVGEYFYAGWRPLWFDELLTYYISGLPDLGAVWDALLSGADGQPPLYYLLSRVADLFTSDRDVAVRLPAIVAMWGHSIILYCWTREFIGRRWAPAAALLPFLTIGSYFATEARPYSLLLLAGAAALYCWTRATRDQSRIIWLFGLGISLALGNCAQYYAALLILPVATGEGVRTLSRKQVDLPVVIAIIVGTLPLVVLYPLIHSYSSYSSGFWAPVKFENLLNVYREQFFGAAPVAVATLCVAVLLSAYRRSQAPVRVETSIRPCEICALVVFLLLPVIGFAVAVLVTRAFLTRYFISAITGAVLLTVAMLSRMRKGQTETALAMTLFLFGVFVRTEIGKVKTSRFPPDLIKLDNSVLMSERFHTLPILVSHGVVYLQMFHYAPKAMASRLHVVADARLALDRLGADTLERTLVSLGKWVPIQTSLYGDFLAQYPRFLLLGEPAFVIRGLVDEDVSLLAVGWIDEVPIYLVTPGKNWTGDEISESGM